MNFSATANDFSHFVSFCIRKTFYFFHHQKEKAAFAFFSTLFWLLILFHQTAYVRSGALFSRDQKKSIETAFKYAVHKINKDKIILPKSNLIYDIQYVPNEDSFHASKKGTIKYKQLIQQLAHACVSFFFIFAVCNQIQNGTYAIFGPSDPLLSAHIYSICYALDVPYIDSRIDAHSNQPSLRLNNSKTHISNLMKMKLSQREFTINLSPSQLLINAAFQDVMTFLKWKFIAILYEKKDGKFL